MKTFGGLTREEKIALLTAWVDGAEIEYNNSLPNARWLVVERPSWHKSFSYRIKPNAPCTGRTVEIDGVKYKLVEV